MTSSPEPGRPTPRDRPSAPVSDEGGSRLRGTWYVVPTPFGEAGELDLPSLHRLVDAAVAWGVDGLTAMGVMAEPDSLAPDERAACIRTVLDAAGGRVPVAVGCSGGGIATVVARVHEARAAGAVAAMVAAPPLLRNLDLLPAFYDAVAADGGLPLIVQDEPAATGVTIPVSVLLACLEASGSRTVKLEDPPTPPKIGRLLAADPGLSVFGGLGGAAALWELERGACGTMTGFAYPEVLRAVRTALAAGDPELAGRMFDRYLPLIAFEAQPVIGLAIRKELLRRRGVLASARTRGLGGPLDRETIGALERILGRLGIDPSIDRHFPAPVRSTGVTD